MSQILYFGLIIWATNKKIFVKKKEEEIVKRRGSERKLHCFYRSSIGLLVSSSKTIPGVSIYHLYLIWDIC